MSESNNSKAKSVIVVGCFDTKSKDFGYLYSCLEETSAEIITLNTGIFKAQAEFNIDFHSEHVAEAGGSDIAELRKSADRGKALEIMGEEKVSIPLRAFCNSNVFCYDWFLIRWCWKNFALRG